MHTQCWAPHHNRYNRALPLLLVLVLVLRLQLLSLW